MPKNSKAQAQHDDSFEPEKYEQKAAQAENDSSGQSRPAAKFSGSGGLQVAVWKQKTEQGFDRYSVKIERNYKDENGGFHATQYLRDSDLLRAQTLLTQADAWIEQEKNRQRGMGSGRNDNSQGVHY